MNINEIKQAIGGTGHHLSRYAAEAAPATVSPEQGAGTPSTGGLTPNPGEAAGGSTLIGYRGASYSGVGPDNAPEQFSAAHDQVARLTAAARNRPEGGVDGQVAAPADSAGVRQIRLDVDQGRGLPSELGGQPTRFKGI